MLVNDRNNTVFCAPYARIEAKDVFNIDQPRGLKVVAYLGLRWMLQSAP